MRALSMLTAESQRTLRYRREEPESCIFLTLRFLRVLCDCAVQKYYHSFSPCHNTCQSLLLFLFLIAVCFAPLTARAQTGEIAGRVVTEDGTGLPNLPVFLIPSAGNIRQVSRDSQYRTFTDDDGKFKFTGLASIRYTISVNNVKGYVRKFDPIAERQNPVYYYAGDNATITMIKGGVITGTVTSMAGEPLISARVITEMVRDAEGRPMRGSGWQRLTDDRGVYRIYGMLPGTHIVFTRNDVSAPYTASSYGDVPTYHPSSTRDTAAEVTVASGGEASGIDIRHRGDRGRVVSGAVIGGMEAEAAPAVSVTIYETPAGTGAGASFIQPGAARGFAFHGLPDGEYLVIARTTSEENNLASAPRRITLRGGDITGLELKLLPLGSISGRIIVESSAETCGDKRKHRLEEFGVRAMRDDLPEDGSVFLPWRSFSMPGSNEKGEFTISGIDPGHFRIGLRLPDENLYVKSITAPANVPARRGAPAAVNNISRNGFAFKQGEKLTGVTVTVAEGAASLRGKVVAEKDGAKLPEKMRLHLVPAELNSADDVSRYGEALVYGDGAIALNNIAPGKYWLIARLAPEDEQSDPPPTPVAWDTVERARLRRDAEALKIEIELKPCQRLAEQIVKFAR